MRAVFQKEKMEYVDLCERMCIFHDAVFGAEAIMNERLQTGFFWITTLDPPRKGDLHFHSSSTSGFGTPTLPWLVGLQSSDQNCHARRRKDVWKFHDFVHSCVSWCNCDNSCYLLCSIVDLVFFIAKFLSSFCKWMYVWLRYFRAACARLCFRTFLLNDFEQWTAALLSLFIYYIKDHDQSLYIICWVDKGPMICET